MLGQQRPKAAEQRVQLATKLTEYAILRFGRAPVACFHDGAQARESIVELDGERNFVLRTLIAHLIQLGFDSSHAADERTGVGRRSPVLCSPCVTSPADVEHGLVRGALGVANAERELCLSLQVGVRDGGEPWVAADGEHGLAANVARRAVRVQLHAVGTG